MEEETIKSNINNKNFWTSLLVFVMPIFISSCLQQLFNTADTIVAGKFVGSAGLAAVGANSYVVIFVLNIAIGMSVGINVVMANYIGMGNKEKIERAVGTIIPFGLVLGLLLEAIGLIFANQIHTLMKTPSDIYDESVTYFRIFILGLPFVVLYNFLSSILKSEGDSKRPLYILIFTGILNCILNVILVLVFHMGVSGVAVATTFSNVLNFILVCIILFNKNEKIFIDLHEIHFDLDEIVRILMVGVPCVIQCLAFTISNIFVQVAVNGFGSLVVAGNVAAFNIENFEFFVLDSFGQGCITFIGQNYGARNFDNCKKIFKIALVECFIITVLITVLFYIFITPISYIFSDDSTVQKFLYMRFMRVGIWIVLEFGFDMGAGALKAIGHAVTVATIGICSFTVFRIAWILVAFRTAYFNSYEGLLTCYPISWIIASVVTIIIYLRITKKVYR